MMKPRLTHWGWFLPGLLIAGLAGPSWARFHSSLGIVIGPGGWGPGYDSGYDPYYGYPYSGYYAEPYPYDRYYYPYAYQPRYVPVAVEQTPSRSEPDDSRRDLTFVEGQIEHAREQIHYDYDDGDISKAQRKAGIHRLGEILDEARADAKANGGFITGQQQADLISEIHGGERVQRTTPPTLSAPEPAGVPLKSVTERVARMRVALDKKVADGAITRAQRDGMVTYLDRTESIAKAQAGARGGTLARDQEEAVRQQLDRAEEAIRQNLVVR